MATEQRTIPAVCPGTDLKFRLTTTKDDFTLAGDKWNIVIKNNLGRTVRRITKNDCYYDDQGRWYFNITNPQVGTYTAIFIGAYEDEDYDEQQRIWTDRQVLFVCREGCMMRQRRQRHPAACPVQYEQVWSCSIDGEDYLADCYGRYVYTSDGHRIQFTNQLSNEVEDMGKVKMQMTGEQFLQLIEGKNPNGAVNTIPELMDVMQGVDDKETIPQKIQDEIDENEEENEATDSDIDEIFDNDDDAGYDAGADDGNDDI
jgi:hypothetical protein